MNLINEEELKIIEDSYDYTKFKDKTALFETKIASDMRHNGEVIEVLGVIKGRNPEHDSYIVRFNDGTIEENVMNCELTFDYHRDKASIETRKELSRIMKLYELSDKEAEELLTASYNYDYEMNEGVVLTNLESIERLFTEEDSEERINPSIKQLKAMAMYIRETKEYYVPFFGYEEYTEKVIDLILNKDETEITKLEFLNEIKDMISHNIMCYSSNYSLEQSKQGYEKEFIRENKKLMLVEQMIKEEKQKENAMKKYIIPLLIVLLCSIIVGGYYQLKKIGITNMSLNKDKPSIQKGDSVNITTQIVSEKKIMEIKYSTREPIPKGDSFTFHVTWDTLYISNIIFKDVYSPTKEEMKNGMYTLVVHPEKTTTYQIQKDYTTGESRILPHEVKVLDEHGIEIK